MVLSIYFAVGMSSNTVVHSTVSNLHVACFLLISVNRIHLILQVYSETDFLGQANLSCGERELLAKFISFVTCQKLLTFFRQQQQQKSDPERFAHQLALLLPLYRIRTRSIPTWVKSSTVACTKMSFPRSTMSSWWTFDKLPIWALMSSWFVCNA